MAEAGQHRVVPGAPPPQIKSTAGNDNKKKKGGARQRQSIQTSTNGKWSESQEALARAVKEATLTEKAPKFGKVDESVKVQVQDVAEQAERNSAIAAVAIVDVSEGNGSAIDKDTKSPLQTALAKRIKVLSKKLQKANTYEALEEERLNADMKRIIASKSNLEGALAEITEILKAVEVSEAAAAKESKQQIKIVMDITRRDLLSEQEKKNFTFYQFLYLRSLFQPSATPTFAPESLPSVVNEVTAQDVAAIEKLFSDLSSSIEVVTQSSKDGMIEKLTSRSGEEIIEGVAFLRISKLIDNLSSPVMKQPQDQMQEAELTEANISPPAAPSGRILFMQESEIVPAQDTKIAQQAEPERGPLESLPEDKDQLTTNGTIMGNSSASVGVRQDESAQVQLEQPTHTRVLEMKEEDLLKVKNAPIEPIPSSSNAGPKKIDWAADDDDWSDMVMQPSDMISSLHQPTILAVSTTQTPSDTCKTKKETPLSPKMNGIRKKNIEPESNTAQIQEMQRKESNDQPRSGLIQNKATPASKITGPIIDEDGFIVASSKKSKQQHQQHQYQHQNHSQYQQQAFRNGGRGVREGGKVNNTRGGAKGGFAGGRQNGPVFGLGRGGSSFADNRGRGRGRGGSKPETSEI